MPSSHEIKQLIIDTLELEDLVPEELGDDEPLFGGRLGLDSIDALELSLALQRTYGVSMEEAGRFKEALSTAGALARWIDNRMQD